MTPEQALDEMTNHCGCISVFTSTEDLVTEALERARVVGVLDTWAESGKYPFFTMPIHHEHPAGGWVCCTRTFGGPEFVADTADAARAAAAKAIEAGEV